jgi:DNA end-binding protein Ku
MAARAIWKGRIRFGGVDVPVKLYSAVESRTVHFRLLDAEKNEPVRQQMVDPETDEPVEHGDIRRAVETGSGELVMLTEEELGELEPEPSRDIEITRFVPDHAISHPWYDRPYYLGPDESGSEYAALAEALRAEERTGVARWVMRNKAYSGALRAKGDHLMLITLRQASEVIPASALEPPSGRELEKRELEMARQLIAAMEDELDLAAFRDEYRDRVMELVEAKAAGKIVRFPRAPKKRKEKSLAEELEKSLSAAKKARKSA